ncbi:MAG: MBL fold metallo-hydrolase [Patescibacteria group bacterium]
MVITYQGENYFKFQAGSLTVLLDPTNQRSFKGAQVVLSTLKPALVATEEIDGEPIFIDHQGEYEIKGIEIRGFSAQNDGKTEKTIYLLKFDEIKIAVLGHLSKELDEKTITHLENAHIVIAPAGGKPYINTETVAKIIKEINPSIIIPSLFKDIKPFLKNFQKNSCETTEKIVVKAKDLKPGALEIKCLTP